MKTTFYSYSYRLTSFLKAFGERYVSVGKNPKTKQRFWTFNKSERLDKIIALYNEVKYKI